MHVETNARMITVNYSLQPVVARALMIGQGVVALESTVIAHGLPAPHNLQTAQQCEQAVSASGAQPATIGIIAGQPVVGLDAEQLQAIATHGNVAKVNLANLAAVLATRGWGATTVAATLHLAHLAGLKVFATGGGSTPGTNAFAAQYSEAEMCALTEEARRLDKRVASHAHGTPGVLTSIAARVTTIEHCSFFRPSGTQYEPEHGRRIADAGIYVCPTIFQGRGKLLTQNPDLPWAAEFRQTQAERFAVIRCLVEQGVQLVSGSDAGVNFNAFTDYPGDLILTVEGLDLSPVYVLKSATSIAAEALGRSDLGVIAPGKAADLLAVQGNPLQDIRALNAPVLVVSRGRVVLGG